MIEEGVIFGDSGKWVAGGKEVLHCSLRRYCLQPTGTESVYGMEQDSPAVALTLTDAERSIMQESCSK